MNEEKTKASNAEIGKLLRAGFFREGLYPEWMSNVVMVVKKNETSR